MGWYTRVVFPRVLNFCMSAPPMTKCRQTLLADTQGDVLEIGFGTGLNLPHYPAHIHRLTTVDVNPAMHPLARKRLQDCPFPVEHHVLNGEALPMPAQTFDCVVSTWTLCSIANVTQALGEIRRVLKPQGRFFFVEHGLSDEPKVQRWQHRLNPLQQRLADGCHLNRNMYHLIAQTPFQIIDIRRFYLEKTPKTHGCTYQGIAMP